MLLDDVADLLRQHINRSFVDRRELCQIAVSGLVRLSGCWPSTQSTSLAFHIFSLSIGLGDQVTTKLTSLTLNVCESLVCLL